MKALLLFAVMIVVVIAILCIFFKKRSLPRVFYSWKKIFKKTANENGCFKFQLKNLAGYQIVGYLKRLEVYHINQPVYYLQEVKFIKNHRILFTKDVEKLGFNDVRVESVDCPCYLLAVRHDWGFELQMLMKPIWRFYYKYAPTGGLAESEWQYFSVVADSDKHAEDIALLEYSEMFDRGETLTKNFNFYYKIKIL